MAEPGNHRFPSISKQICGVNFMSVIEVRSTTIYVALIGAIVTIIVLTGCAQQQDDVVKDSGMRNLNLFGETDSNRFGDFDEKPAKPPGKPIVTASGIQFQDLEEGFGLSPSIDRLVMVHYTGYLSGGGKFESSRDKGIPIAFIVGKGQMIRGLEEGIMGMKVGGKRKLIIPPALGYGSQSHGNVRPNSTLTYEVELLSSDR